VEVGQEQGRQVGGHSFAVVTIFNPTVSTTHWYVVGGTDSFARFRLRWPVPEYGRRGKGGSVGDTKTRLVAFHGTIRHGRQGRGKRRRKK
jgi:hypothetical protein